MLVLNSLLNPKLNVKVYLNKPNSEFLYTIKSLWKYEKYIRDPVFNLNSSHSKLTKEDVDFLLIIADNF